MISVVAIIVNHNKESCMQLALQLAEQLQRMGITVSAPAGSYAYTVNALDGIDFSGLELAIVVGGDGTILSAGRVMSYFDVPVCGVNMGRVGFLAEIEPEKILAVLPLLLEGRYQLEERMMLQCCHIRNGGEIDYGPAFNDVVLNSGFDMRTVCFDLRIDGQDIHSYQADGIIVSTPTGSTGYSFSAGGPIIMPAIDAMLILPVCPHTFFSRPLVVASTSVVEIFCRNFKDSINLIEDGIFCSKIEIGDLLRISVGEHKVKLVRFSISSQFQRLKSKFYQI